VLCLAVLEGGDLISGSGDTTIKRWQGTKCVATYKGHTDTVRGLAALPGVGFVSGSHDCSLRVWSLDGTTLAEMHGHTAIIYSVAAAGSSGLIASGSEDNTVRLWSSAGACLQVLDHPGCVWAVAFTPAGDLVSGCSDAVGRVWSSSQERQVRARAGGKGSGVGGVRCCGVMLPSAC
jgi:phospholipase A-2-activating protein